MLEPNRDLCPPSPGRRVGSLVRRDLGQGLCQRLPEDGIASPGIDLAPGDCAAICQSPDEGRVQAPRERPHREEGVNRTPQQLQA